MCSSMRAVADVLPDAGYRTLPGQTHMLKPAAVAPVLAEFLLQSQSAVEERQSAVEDARG